MFLCHSQEMRGNLKDQENQGASVYIKKVFMEKDTKNVFIATKILLVIRPPQLIT